MTRQNQRGLPAREYIAKIEADPKRAAALQRARERARAGAITLPLERWIAKLKDVAREMPDQHDLQRKLIEELRGVIHEMQLGIIAQAVEGERAETSVAALSTEPPIGDGEMLEICDAEAARKREAAAPAPDRMRHKPAVQQIMDLARRFRSAPGDLYDDAYKAVEQAAYQALESASNKQES